MNLEETTIKSDKIYEGKVLNLRLDTVEIPGKKYSKREIIEVSNASAIVPVLDDGKIIMVRQFRKAIEKVTLEIPAGKLEPGEDPRECADRELKEETGYSANKMTYMNEIYSSPGYCNEKLHLFLARELVEGEQDLDDNEVIEIESYTVEDLLKMISRGEINDAKTVAGIYMASEYLIKK